MSNLVNRGKSEISLAPSPVGTTLMKVGGGALAVSAIAWLLPGGFLLWAMIMLIAGVVL